MPSTKPELVRRFEVKRIGNGIAERVLDSVATEEPLEIRLSYYFKDVRTTTSLAVTMRTPGHDRELAAGFLLTEGIVRERGDIVEVRQMGIQPSGEILVELAKHIDVDAWRLARNSFVSASCGICGKRTREALRSQVPSAPQSTLTLSRQFIGNLPELLRGHQEGFAETGGLHAAALINARGELESSFEDIGRHNALDKLIGHNFLAGGSPLQEHVVFLSSRSSFELVQKTAMAGCPILATVGGPSSLAIEAARDYGLTLIGFVRQQRFNVYSGEWRINL
jgi:FdhD protein